VRQKEVGGSRVKVSRYLHGGAKAGSEAD